MGHEETLALTLSKLGGGRLSREGGWSDYALRELF